MEMGLRHWALSIAARGGALLQRSMWLHCPIWRQGEREINFHARTEMPQLLASMCQGLLIGAVEQRRGVIAFSGMEQKRRVRAVEQLPWILRS
jgi:hypothetical protein